jgi:hypothetical protein
MVERQGYVVAITIPVTKIIKATTYRTNMILEIRMKLGIISPQVEIYASIISPIAWLHAC